MGSYFLQLRGKVDAVVFSAGMGENSAFLRARILEDLDVGSQSTCMMSRRSRQPLRYLALCCPLRQDTAIIAGEATHSLGP